MNRSSEFCPIREPTGDDDAEVDVDVDVLTTVVCDEDVREFAADDDADAFDDADEPSIASNKPKRLLSDSCFSITATRNRIVPRTIS